MIPGLDKLVKRIEKIEKRNSKVESDRAWETSYARRGLIAIVPSVGFLLSTLTLPLFKKFWLKNIYKK